MSQQWMIEILADLRNCASRNTMFHLAEQLDDAIIIAGREMRSTSDLPKFTSGHDDPNTNPYRATADNDHSG